VVFYQNQENCRLIRKQSRKKPSLLALECYDGPTRTEYLENKKTLDEKPTFALFEGGNCAGKRRNYLGNLVFTYPSWTPKKTVSSQLDEQGEDVSHIRRRRAVRA